MPTVGEIPRTIAGAQAGQAARSTARFPGFDGLRAIAAMSVLLDHAGGWSGATAALAPAKPYLSRLGTGVAIFFVISGFLLYRPFVAAHLKGDAAPRLGSYFIRRLTRIVPAYWLALLVSVYALHVASLGRGWQGVIAGLGFSQIYDPNYYFTGLAQAWSLCTEMSFYLVLPLYAVLVAGRRKRRETALRREVTGLLVLVVLSIGFQVWVTQVNDSFSCHASGLECLTRAPLTIYMSTWLFYNLELFAAGMLLAVASVALSQRSAAPKWLAWRAMPVASWALAMVSFVLLAHIGNGVSAPRLSPGKEVLWTALVVALAGLLVLPAALQPHGGGLVRRILGSWPLAAVGTISYGVYLWHLTWIEELVKLPGAGSWEHEPLGFLGLVGLVVAASLAAAAASWFLLERPILRLVHRRPRAPSARVQSYLPAAVSPVEGS